jgi:hypothetical protein
MATIYLILPSSRNGTNGKFWLGDRKLFGWAISGVITIALLIKLFVLMNSSNQLHHSMELMSPWAWCQFYGPKVIWGVISRFSHDSQWLYSNKRCLQSLGAKLADD